MIQIDIEGPVYSQISFAHVVRSIAFALDDLGCDISIRATDPYSAGYKTVANERNYDRLTSMINRPPAGQIKILYNFPVSMKNRCKGYNFAITSWETTSAPLEWIKELNLFADQVWSISSFVNEAFLAGGLQKDKAKILPMGVDPAIFSPKATPAKIETKKSFKFLHLGVAQERKGTPLLLSAYNKAFSIKDNVCLIVKSNGFGQIARLIDLYKTGPEIRYIYEETHENDIAGYYLASDCFIYPVHAEGAGLPVLESLACGKPAIVPLYSGLLDFCDTNNCFAIKYKESALTKPYSSYSGIGVEQWANLSEIDLIEQMRFAFNNKDIVRKKGAFAAQTTKKFTWRQTAIKILDYINEKLKDKNLSTKIDKLKTIQIPEKIKHQTETIATNTAVPIAVLSSYDVFIESYHYANVSINHSFSNITTLVSKNIKNRKFIPCFEKGQASAGTIAKICLDRGIFILQVHWDRTILPIHAMPHFLRTLHDAGLKTIICLSDEIPNTTPVEFFHLARFFVVNSARMRNHLLQRGCPLEKLKYCPPIKIETDLTQRELTRTKYKFGSNNFVVMTPVYLDTTSSCIEAMQELKKENEKLPHLKYVLFVLGGNQKIIDEHIVEFKKYNFSSIIMNVPEMVYGNILSMADAFFTPYKSEAQIPKNPNLMPLISFNIPIISDSDSLTSELQFIIPRKSKNWEEIASQYIKVKENLIEKNEYIKLMESLYYNLAVTPTTIPERQIVKQPLEPTIDIDMPISFAEL